MAVKTERPTDAYKGEVLRLRLTESDKAEIARMAEAEGLTMSEYIRKHLLRERGSIDRPKVKT